MNSYYSFGAYEFVANCNKYYYNQNHPDKSKKKNMVSVLGSPEKPYGKVCDTGSIIDIYLDLDKKTLSYHIDGKDYGVAFEDVKEGTYRLAVTLTGKGTTVQILSYSCLE